MYIYITRRIPAVPRFTHLTRVRIILKCGNGGRMSRGLFFISSSLCRSSPSHFLSQRLSISPFLQSRAGCVWVPQHPHENVILRKLIVSDVFFSGTGQHHVQHMLQDVRVPLRARDPLQEPHEGTAVQMYRMRPRVLDKGTIYTGLL